MSEEAKFDSRAAFAIILVDTLFDGRSFTRVTLTGICVADGGNRGGGGIGDTVGGSDI